MIPIRMIISAGSCNQEWMTMKICINDQLITEISQWDHKPQDIDLEISPPSVLKFFLAGKNKHDTIIDQQGNILQDKFVKINSICINGMWIKNYLLESRVLNFRAENGSKSQSNYFGQNGCAELAIPADLLEFWLDLMIDQ